MFSLFLNFFKKKEILIDGKLKKENFNFYRISSYYRNIEINNPFYTVNDRTWEDLELDEVFTYIDRTISRIGQQYLYYKLRVIKNHNELVKFCNLTSYFENNKEQSDIFRKHLHNLHSERNYDFERIVNFPEFSKKQNVNTAYLLNILTIIVGVASFFTPLMSIFLLPIFVTNLVLHYRNKNDIELFLGSIIQFNQSFKTYNKMYENSKFRQYYKLERLMSLEKIYKKTKFLGWEKFINNEFMMLIWFISEIVKITFNVEFIIFNRIIDDFKNEKKALNKLYCTIGEIDSSLSCISIKNDVETYCAPEFTTEKKISIVEMYHPLVQNCIKNTVTLENESIILTGSNMSGKTTFMRSIAINAILGQTINLCFAKQFVVPHLKVYTSIKISDNIIEGKSYYLEEVSVMKELIDQVKTYEYNLFIVDEIFKGTNSVDKVSAGISILSYLNSKKNIVLTSTHDIEIAQELAKESFQCYYLEEHYEDNGFYFTYKLKSGVQQGNNAISILSMYNYPIEIVEEALKFKANKSLKI